MALGFNNQPVDFNHAGVLLANQSGDRIGYGIAQMGRGISEGIQGYFQKKEKKDKEQKASEILKAYMQQAGMDPKIWGDDKAIKAGVESIGPDGVLQMVGMVQKRQEQEADRQRIAQSIKVYTDAMAQGASHEQAAANAGNTFVQAGGRDLGPLMEYMGQIGDARYKSSREKMDAERLKLEKMQTEAARRNEEFKRNLELFKATQDAAAQSTDMAYKQELTASMADNRKTNAESRAIMNEQRKAQTARIIALTQAAQAKNGDKDVTKEIVTKYESGDDAGALAQFRKAFGSDMMLSDMEEWIATKDKSTPQEQTVRKEDGPITAPGGFTIRVK